MEELEKKEEAEDGVGEEETKIKNKINFRFEAVLFLILGFLLGVVIKTEATKRVTIGFNDSEIASVKQSYNFEKIKKEIAEKSAASQSAPQENQAPQANQGEPNSQ